MSDSRPLGFQVSSSPAVMGGGLKPNASPPVPAVAWAFCWGLTVFVISAALFVVGFDVYAALKLWPVFLPVLAAWLVVPAATRGKT